MTAVEAVDGDGDTVFFLIDRDKQEHTGRDADTGNPEPPHDVLTPVRPQMWRLQLPERDIEVCGHHSDIYALAAVLLAAGETVATPEETNQ